jgi:hypothetical protein
MRNNSRKGPAIRIGSSSAMIQELNSVRILKMYDRVLEQYRQSVIKQTGKDCPSFAEEARHIAPILAILETPGNSGAQRSQVCSLDNNDPTARRTAKIIESVGLSRKQIVFWNFFAAYERGQKDRAMWAEQLCRLIPLLPKLRTLITFGDEAWRGLRDVDLSAGIFLIGAPHPSNRSCNSNSNAEQAILRAWERAKANIG